MTAGRRGAALVTLVVAATIAAAASPQSPDLCAAAVTQQLQRWGAAGTARTTAAQEVRRWPTRELGTWITEVRTPATVALVQVSPAHLTRIVWNADCAARMEQQPRPAATAPRFTDADLAALVASGDAGVVFVWSPHMPLSVDGYRAVATAAAARSLAVHAMLEPGADRAFAQQSLARGALPDAALRVADSVELAFRDVHLHTPMVLVYGRGRIIGDPWPGYHTAEEYGAFLDRVLTVR